jgi:hypothetical protein
MTEPAVFYDADAPRIEVDLVEPPLARRVRVTHVDVDGLTRNVELDAEDARAFAAAVLAALGEGETAPEYVHRIVDVLGDESARLLHFDFDGLHVPPDVLARLAYERPAIPADAQAEPVEPENAAAPAASDTPVHDETEAATRGSQR